MLHCCYGFTSPTFIIYNQARNRDVQKCTYENSVANILSLLWTKIQHYTFKLMHRFYPSITNEHPICQSKTQVLTKFVLEWILANLLTNFYTLQRTIYGIVVHGCVPFWFGILNHSYNITEWLIEYHRLNSQLIRRQFISKLNCMFIR